MKKTIVLFFLVFQLLSYSQEMGGEVYYKVVFAIDSTLKEKSSRVDLMQQKAIAGSDKINLKLVFNKEESVFSLVESIEDSEVKFAIAWANCRNKILTVLKENKSYYNNSASSLGVFKDKEFLVYTSLQNNWKFLNETKLIDKLICYKAIQEIEYRTSKGTQTKTITAWFCPELPYSFGPKGYFGLPGLILELTDRNTTFIANKIVLSKNINVEFSKEGKLISHEEYQEIIRTRMADLKNTLTD
ncbi:GLPGLI family protein [Flavobacterium okayamense]|uniref:GLPGLI family protein n=1 Tax=Flavobacterium okayamense TaxID=2830782 RepID=A0ABM7S4T1_9FLAO|nr:GLPGLI family protein [Flavobacterium okayamense]BCY27794.1 GLPGLI family protein [Flavobacterium okayamense]